MNQDTSASLSSELIDFYLVQSPYAHSDKPSSARSVDLQSLGWEKTNLDLLMRWITKELGDGGLEARLSFTIANKIPNELLQSFMLNSIIAISPYKVGAVPSAGK